MISTTIGVVALISAIGSGVLALGDHPPWVGMDRFAQMDRRQDLSELNDIDAKIAVLERAKQNGRLTPFEAGLLQRLYLQRRVLCAKLKVQGC